MVLTFYPIEGLGPIPDPLSKPIMEARERLHVKNPRPITPSHKISLTI